jgi:hypothetical protein
VAVVLTVLRLIQGIGVGFTYGTLVVGASRDLLISGLVATALGFITAPSRRTVGSHRPQEGLHWRLRVRRRVHVRLFRAAQHEDAGARFPRRGALLHSGDDNGSEAALIAEAFTPRLRYSGASIGYQLASIIAGGPAPIIATWLFSTYKSALPIGLYVSVCATISICAAFAAPRQTQ